MNRLNRLSTKIAILNDVMPQIRAIMSIADWPDDTKPAPVRIGAEPMNLTEEEQTKLASLHGKEKKAYVKELRVKYAS